MVEAWKVKRNNLRNYWDKEGRPMKWHEEGKEYIFIPINPEYNDCIGYGIMYSLPIDMNDGTVSLYKEYDGFLFKYEDWDIVQDYSLNVIGAFFPTLKVLVEDFKK